MKSDSGEQLPDGGKLQDEQELAKKKKMGQGFPVEEAARGKV